MMRSPTSTNTPNWRRVLLVMALLVAIPVCNGFSSLFPRKARNLPSVSIVSRGGSNPFIPSQLDSTSSSREEPPTQSTLSNYHLLWSPNVWKKLLLSTALLWVTFQMAPTWKINLLQRIAIPVMIPAKLNTLVLNGILPTLSSACCWIQIILNAVTALGCAGFNTYLGPLRPFFLSILTYLTITTRSHTKPSTMILRWTIALLPELLHFWNTSRMKIGKSNSKTLSQQTTTTSAATPTTDVAVYLDCPTMGCVACIQNVNSSLQKAMQSDRSICQIQSVDAWLLEGNRKGGKAKIRFSTTTTTTTTTTMDKEDGVDPKIVSKLTQSLQKSGFPCSVDVVRATPARRQ